MCFRAFLCAVCLRVFLYTDHVFQGVSVCCMFQGVSFCTLIACFVFQGVPGPTGPTGPPGQRGPVVSPALSLA